MTEGKKDEAEEVEYVASPKLFMYMFLRYRG